MAVNGYAAASDVAATKVSTAALAVAMGTRVNLVEEILGPIASDVAAMTQAVTVDIPNALATKVITTDLSSITGASGVGFQQDLDGAIPRTLAEKAGEIVSVFDFVGATDMAKLIAAFASDAYEIVVPRGGIDITSETVVPVVGHKRLNCSGPIRFSGTGSLQLGGGVSAIPTLAADLVPWNQQATFVSPHGLIVGDVFGYHNQNPYSFSKHRPDYTDGQMFRVEKVISPTVVRFSGHVKRVFPAALTGDYLVPSMFKLAGGSLDLDNVLLDPVSTSSSQVFTLDGLVGLRANPVRCTNGAQYSAAIAYSCYDYCIIHPRVQAYEVVSFPDDAYPINIASCQKGIILGGTGAYGSWHCFTTGGGGGLGRIPTADLLVQGFMAWNDRASGVGSIDSHGNSEDITYSDGTAHCANLGGRNITLRNCNVYGWPDVATLPSGSGDGNIIYSGETVGGHHLYQNCRFFTNGLGQTDAFIHHSIDKLSEDFLLELDNCRFVYDGAGGDLDGANLIRLYLGTSAGAWGTNHSGGPHSFKVIIDGMKWSEGMPGPFAILSLSSDSGGPDIVGYGSLRLGNRNEIPGGGRIIAASNADNYDGMDIVGRGCSIGTTYRGDSNVALKRSDTEYQVFNTQLTDFRTVDLPDEVWSVPGDTFVIKRGGVNSNIPLNVRIGDANSTPATLTYLWVGDWIRVVRKGPLMAGGWDIVERGTIAGPSIGHLALGNESVTLDLEPSSANLARKSVIHVLPITADRSVTLNGSGGTPGSTIRIIRAAAATGAFNVNVGPGPLKALSVGQWCDVTWDGSVWYLSAFGSL